MAIISSISRRIRLSGPYMVAGGLLGLFLLWPHFWVWFNNPEPTVMTLEQFLANGSKREWLVLQGSYVDATAAVRTELTSRRGTSPTYYYTYYPLTTGPSDSRPPKVYVQPSHLIQGRRVYLVGPGESDEVAHKRFSEENGTQEVTGLLAVGIYDAYRAQDIVRGRGAPDAVILLQNKRPPDAVAALAAVLGPIALGFLGAALVLRNRRRKTV